MSNITFDVKCVRADPQSGICELPQPPSSGGSSITVVPYSGNFNLPATIPSNSELLGGATELNTLSLFAGSSVTGYYKIIDNLVEVTQVITGINYTVASPAQPGGFGTPISTV